MFRSDFLPGNSASQFGRLTACVSARESNILVCQPAKTASETHAIGAEHAGLSIGLGIWDCPPTNWRCKKRCSLGSERFTGLVPLHGGLIPKGCGNRRSCMPIPSALNDYKPFQTVPNRPLFWYFCRRNGENLRFGFSDKTNDYCSGGSGVRAHWPSRLVP
jgi:hypothetical protein